MAESSEVLINNLNAQIVKLQDELARTRHEAKTRKLGARDLQAQLDKALADLKTLETDRDDWKTKAEAAPSDTQQKLDEALGQLRSRDHRDAWREAIGPELADKVTINDVWSKIQYKPGETLPTAAEITEQVKTARDVAPFLFKSAPDGASSAPANGAQVNGRPPLKGADDSSRGGPDKTGKSLKVRKSDLQNPQWSLNPLNQKAMTDASAAGLLEVIDG